MHACMELASANVHRSALIQLRRVSQQHLSADPLACACCNSLLLMYKEASPVQASRSLSLLLAMSEYVLAAPDPLLVTHR